MMQFTITQTVACPYWMRWPQAAEALGISSHANQLAKKQNKYPGHFMTDGNNMYISRVLFEALREFYHAQQYLVILKKEVRNEAES